jgi:hypothetical protein
MSYQSINPFDGKTLKTFDDLTDKVAVGGIGADSTLGLKLVAANSRFGPALGPALQG